MRGHVTAASIKTNLYCKETPLALFVCHEPRLFPWNLCWAPGRSLYCRGPPGQAGAGWEGALAGSIPWMLSQDPLDPLLIAQCVSGSCSGPQSAGAVPLGAGAGTPRLRDRNQGLGCAGPAPLGHWGDRARQPPAAWLPQKQHAEWRLLSLHLLCPTRSPGFWMHPTHAETGTALLSQSGGGHLHVQMHCCWNCSTSLGEFIYLKLASGGSSSQSLVIWGGGQSSLGTSLDGHALGPPASSDLPSPLCIVFAWKLSAAVSGLSSECQSWMNRAQAPHNFLLSWLEGDLQFLHIFVMFPILSSPQLFLTPFLSCSTKSSQWLPRALPSVSEGTGEHLVAAACLLTWGLHSSFCREAAAVQFILLALPL